MSVSTPKVRGDGLEDLLEPAERELPVRQQRALVDAHRAVGDDERRVDLLGGAEAVAGGAGAVRAVEAEDARLDLGQRDAAVHAGELLAEREGLAVGGLDLDEAVGELGGGLDGVGEPPPQALLHHQPVDDDGDVVLVLLVEVDVLLELAHLAVDLDAREAVGAELLEQLAVLALAAAHHRRDDAEPGAAVEVAHLVDDLLDALPGDGAPALRAVRVADARVQQAQVVVDLGDRADRGARVARRGLLVDGDGRREALDAVHVGLVHLPEELARVGRQRLDVAALALGVDGVEGQRRLARAREAGDDDEAVARQPQGDVLEVVLAGAGDDEIVIHACGVTPDDDGPDARRLGLARRLLQPLPRARLGRRGARPHAREREALLLDEAHAGGDDLGVVLARRRRSRTSARAASMPRAAR